MGGFTRVLRKSFAARVFAGLFLVVLGTTVSITVFHFRQARARSETALRHQGLALARLLANQSRLGVFAGNPELLRPAVEAVVTQRNVVAVSVFSKEGTLLRRVDSARAAGACREMPEISAEPGPLENSMDGRAWFEVAVPVLAGRRFGDASAAPAEIGRVCLALSTASLVSEGRALVGASIIAGTVFLLLALAGGYLVVQGVTRPLRRLTRAVRVFGEGRPVRAVPVETEDEIGELARALNEAGAALVRRQAEKERLEQQLRHAQKMEAIGRLTGGIAHDFNNILTTIRCYERLLRMPGQDPGMVAVHARAIGEAVDRGARSVKALLAFSRKQATRLEPVELCRLLRRMRDLLDRLLPDGIEVVCEIKTEEVWVEADAGELEQVFVNLATNARDAMPDGGRLVLGVEAASDGVPEEAAFGGGRGENFVLVTVRDTGTGMDPETLESVFDPFFTTKPVGQGTGLGLSVAYGILEAHRGHITVESEPGRGTTFRILLPWIPAPEDAGRDRAAAGAEIRPPQEPVP